MSNLLYEILSEMEWDMLIEEGRDPVELIHYKFQNVPSEVIDRVIAIDPTKKKSYSRWALDKWDKESEVIVSALKSGRLKTLFDQFKAKQGEKNAMKLSDFTSVFEVLRDYVPEEDTVLVKSDKPTTYVMNLGEEVDSDLANDFDIVYRDESWIIAVPNTYEAECKLGENMQWCTANEYGRGRDYYEEYLEKGGKYYVNFDLTTGESNKGKSYPYTRYQFHFETRQFKDKCDNQVDIFGIGMPDDAFKYYESVGYDMNKYMSTAEKRNRYINWREQFKYDLNNGIESTSTLYLNIGFDHRFTHIDVGEDTKFFVYDDNDNADPIGGYMDCGFGNPHIDPSFIKESGNYYHILTDRNGRDNFFLYDCETDNRRKWDLYQNALRLPLDGEVFSVDSAVYMYIFRNGSLNMIKQPICIKNMKIRWKDGGWVYIETTDDGDGFHSLVRVNDSTYEVVVVRDIPKNGDWFSMDENGVIEGRLRYYHTRDDYNGEDNPLSGVYVYKDMGKFFMVARSGKSRYMEFNLVRVGERSLFLPEWFDKIGFYRHLFICADSDHKYTIYDYDGKQIGEKYTRIGFKCIDKNVLICDDIQGKHCFIDFETGEIFGKFDNISYVCEQILFVKDKSLDPQFYKFYDLNKRCIIHPELSPGQRIFDECYSCVKDDGNGNQVNVLYDVYDDIVITEYVSLKNFSYQNIIVIQKPNGKFNAWYYGSGINYIVPNEGDVSIKDEFLLPFDVDEISNVYDKMVGTRRLRYITYKLNGRYFIYDYNVKELRHPKNGSILEFHFNSSTKWPFFCETENYRLYFDIYLNDIDYFGYSEKNWRSNVHSLKEPNVPQEVIDGFAMIFGRDVIPPSKGQPQEQEVQVKSNAVKEEFFRMLNRIDEAFKLIHNL